MRASAFRNGYKAIRKFLSGYWTLRLKLNGYGVHVLGLRVLGQPDDDAGAAAVPSGRRL